MITSEYTNVVSNLLAGNSAYTPNYLYLEFKNTTEYPVNIPDLSYMSGKEYYNNLDRSNGTDISYLRVPITLKPVVDTNSVTYTTLVSTTESMNSNVIFSADAHSCIYGVALVVALDDLDPTQDIVIAQNYLEGANRQLVAIDNQTFCFSFKLNLHSNELLTETSNH